jgi:hypothetical protein
MRKTMLMLFLASSLCAPNELTTNTALKKEVEALEARHNDLREQNRILREKADTLLETARRVAGTHRNVKTAAESASIIMRLYGEEPVLIEKKDASQKAMVQKWYSVPLEGKRYRFTAMIKGDAITGGAKFGLLYSSGGKSIWPAASVGTGTFDWKKASFEATLPFGVKSYLLMLGIEGAATGTIGFKDVLVELLP